MDKKVKVPITYWLYVFVVSSFMFALWYLLRGSTYMMFASTLYYEQKRPWEAFFVVLLPFVGIMYVVFFLYAWLQRTRKEENVVPKDMISKFMKSKLEVFYFYPEIFVKYNWYAWCVFLLLLLSFLARYGSLVNFKKGIGAALLELVGIILIFVAPLAFAPVGFFCVFKWLLQGGQGKANNDPSVVVESKSHFFIQRLKTVLKYVWYIWSICLFLIFCYAVLSGKYTLDFVGIILMLTVLSWGIAGPFFLFRLLKWIGRKLLTKRYNSN